MGETMTTFDLASAIVSRCGTLGLIVDCDDTCDEFVRVRFNDTGPTIRRFDLDASVRVLDRLRSATTANEAQRIVLAANGGMFSLDAWPNEDEL